MAVARLRPTLAAPCGGGAPHIGPPTRGSTRRDPPDGPYGSLRTPGHDSHQTHWSHPYRRQRRTACRWGQIRPSQPPQRGTPGARPDRHGGAKSDCHFQHRPVRGMHPSRQHRGPDGDLRKFPLRGPRQRLGHPTDGTTGRVPGRVIGVTRQHRTRRARHLMRLPGRPRIRVGDLRSRHQVPRLVMRDLECPSSSQTLPALFARRLLRLSNTSKQGTITNM